MEEKKQREFKHATTKEKMKLIIKEFDFNITSGSKYDKFDIVNIVNEMEEEEIINFSIHERNTDGDYWLQVEYYSNKIGKTLIWDYNFWEGDTNEEFIDILFNLQEEINKFETKKI